MGRDEANISRRYAQNMYEALRYRATWPPSQPIELGAVGVLADGVFDQRTTLKGLGINFSVESSKSPSSFEYQSARGVSKTMKAAGETSSSFWLWARRPREF